MSNLEKAFYDDFPPEEKVIEAVEDALERLLPGLPIKEATFTVSFADGTAKSWKVKPPVEHWELHTDTGGYDE
jgi:hypothetical protein